MDKELRNAKILVARRIILWVLAATILVTGVALGWSYFQRLNVAASQAEITPIRELLIEAVRNTKVDAPIDPKTGDVYFPTARLYLQNASSYTRLTYAYNPEDGADLTIADKTVLDRGIASLYSVQDFYELFTKLPYLQACQRGVTVTYGQLNEPGKELRQTVKLNNGKTISLYTEQACPELNETVTLLKNLKAY